MLGDSTLTNTCFRRFLGSFFLGSNYIPPQVWCLEAGPGNPGFPTFSRRDPGGVWYPIGGLPKGKRWLFADSN